MPAEAVPAEEIWRRLLGSLTSQSLCVAAELQLADHLGDGEMDVDDLATKAGALPDRLARVLRLLSSEGVFREVAPDRFANTPLSHALRSDHPQSQRDFAAFVRQIVHPAAGELLHGVTTDEPAFEKAFGAKPFDMLFADPDATVMFTKAMASAATLRTDLADAYAWPESATIVDVGGADGTILAQVLAPRPGLRGIVFDQPHNAEGAHRVFEEAGIADRAEFVGGSFFEEVPAGGDIYALSAVLHDWDDDNATTILENCRAAMGPDGKLLILDFVLPSGDDWHPGKVLDVVMLTLLTGRERYDHEWSALLERGGFSITSVTPSTRVSLIEARPVR